MNPALVLLLVLGATIALHPRIDGRFWYIGVLLVILGALMLAANPVRPRTHKPHADTTLTPLRRWHVGAALIGVFFLTSSVVRSFPANWETLPFLTVHVQHALFVVGALLLLIGAGGWRFNRVRFNRTALAIGAILVLAFVLRVYHLETHLPFMVEEWLFAGPAGVMDNDTPLFYQISFYATSPRLYV